MVPISRAPATILLILLPSPPAAFPTARTIGDLPPDEKAVECVILLHGLGRTRRSMNNIAARLKDLGYMVWNEGYPSTEKPITSLVSDFVRPAVEWAEKLGARKIHVVTHSLGGILIRVYLQENTLPIGSRIVMISPPNNGSEVAERLKPFFLYRWIMGPAGQEIGISPDGVPKRLKPVAADIGIIAGTRSMEPWFSMLIPGQDDGKVSVESTKLEEMNDFLTVKSTHPFIMNDPKVIDQVVIYLRQGRFCR
jgi:triacylglycerol lipase